MRKIPKGEKGGFWDLAQVGAEDYVNTYNLPTKYGDLYREKYPHNLYNVTEEEFKNWCRENDIKLLLSFTTIKKDLYEVDVDNMDFKPNEDERTK
jgi:hypothetical protein